MENSMEFSQKTELPHDPAIPLLGIEPKESKAALFTIAKMRKQPKCPSADEWVKTTCHMYTVGDCSATKKNATVPCAATRMGLELTILSQ